MPIIDSSLSTLTQIRTKVRRLTRSLSTSQLTDAAIDDYINTFVLYDFPSHLRLFSLRKTLSFYTQPYVDVYENNTINSSDPLYNFNNKYVSIHAPIFIAGYNAFFSQSREQFFAIYPKLASILTTGFTGDGITTAFSGTLSYLPVLQNNVMFTSVGANSVGLVLIDIPRISPASGLKTMTGDLVVPDTTTSMGTINYATGVYSFSFPIAPASGQIIYSQTVPSVAAQSKSFLFFDNKITLRPVPDKSYRVDVEAYIRPTELLNSSDIPEMAQWWQYIAYGASKKVFEDRMDAESIQMIMPEYKEQELLVLRKTLMLNANERTSTIYTEQSEPGVHNNSW